MIMTVDTDHLMTPTMLSRYNPRQRPEYASGMRAILEALGIELPDPIKRKSPGVRRSDTPSRMTLWRDQRKVRDAAAQATANG